MGEQVSRPTRKAAKAQRRAPKAGLLVFFAVIAVTAIGTAAWFGTQYRDAQAQIKTLEQDLVNANVKINILDERLDEADEIRDERDFWHRNAVILPFGSNVYHLYGCPRAEGAGYTILDTVSAIIQGYSACPICRPLTHS